MSSTADSWPKDGAIVMMRGTAVDCESCGIQIYKHRGGTLYSRRLQEIIAAHDAECSGPAES